MRKGWVAALGVAVAIGVLGCGNGDGDGGAAEGGVDADEVSAPAPCSPVGEELEATATQTVPIRLQDFSFTPSTVQVAPGVVTFAAINAGSENHELAFLPGGGEVPLTPAGEPDEPALEQAGAFELEALGPGGSCDATYELAAGTYTLFCIVTGADGETHYDKGMRGQLTVA